MNNDQKAIPIIGTLTGIRGFAAIWVVLYHLRYMLVEYYGETDFTQFILRGYLGVDLFAFVSGFIITHTYNEQLYNFNWKNTGRFLWLRFARTYPLHFFVLSLFVFLLLRERGWIALEVLPYDTTFTNQIFMLHGLGIETEWKWNVPSWSLSSEWFCYLIFPFIIHYIMRINKGINALIAAVSILIITVAIMYAVDHPYFDAYLDYGLFRIAGEFFTGCLLYRAYKVGTFCNKWTGWIGLIIIATSLFILVRHPNIPTFVAIFGFAAFTYTLAQSQSPLNVIFNNRICVYLGEISYSIYMLHWFIVINEEQFGFNQIHLSFRPWFMLGLVILASAITYELIERPSRHWLRGLKIGRQ